MSLTVISGNLSLTSQYYILINPRTLATHKLPSVGYLRVTHEPRSMVVAYKTDDLIPPNYAAIESRTHGTTLDIINGDVITFVPIIQPTYATSLKIRLRKTNKIVNNPYLKLPLYVDVGYSILCS